MTGPQICPHTTIGIPSFIHILCGTSCPRCTVKAHMARIKNVQKLLKERGGVFESKVAGNTGSSSHQQLKTEWRKAKIALLNLVEQCEEMLRQRKDCENGCAKLPKGWKVLVEAIKDFEKEKVGLGMVPGVEVLPDDIEVAEWEKAKEMEVMQKEREVAEELKVRVGRREAMKAKAIAHCMIRELSGILKTVIEEVDEEIVRGERLAATYASACDSFHSNTSAESHMNETPSDAASRSSLKSGKPEVETDGETNELGFVEIIDKAKSLDPEGTLLLDPSTLKTERYPSPTNPGRNSLAAPRSALRRKLNINCPSAASKKRATIADEVLITEAHSLSNIDNSSPATTVKPHSTHTKAEDRRLQAHFKRTSSRYTPNSWASPDGCEKINTSYFRLDWPHFEKVWAEDEVKRYDTTGGSRDILEWSSPDAYEKLREESMKGLNRETKEAREKDKVEVAMKKAKEIEKKDTARSVEKKQDDTAVAHGQNGREVLTHVEEESNQEAKETRKKQKTEALVRTIREIQKEEAPLLCDTNAYAKQRGEHVPLKRAEDEFKKSVQKAAQMKEWDYERKRANEIDEKVTQHEQERLRSMLRVAGLTWVWMWVLKRLGYAWGGGGWGKRTRVVELEEHNETD